MGNDSFLMVLHIETGPILIGKQRAGRSAAFRVIETGRVQLGLAQFMRKVSCRNVIKTIS